MTEVHGYTAIGLRLLLLLLHMQAFAAVDDASPVKQIEKLQQQVQRLAGEGRFGDAAAPATELVKRLVETRGEAHEETARALNLLGAIQMRTGDLTGAETSMRRSLVVAEKLFGPKDIRVASVLNNLAVFLLNTGRSIAAEPLLMRTLRIKESVHGVNHPRLISTLNSLAGLYQDTGDTTLAEPLLIRTLQMAEESFGPTNATTASCQRDLGFFFLDRGEYRQAEPLFEASLATVEKLMGVEHPAIAAILHGLASLNASMGVYHKALGYSVRALKITETATGGESIETAAALNSLGTIHLWNGDYEEAESLLSTSLRIRKKLLGPDHTDSVTAMNNLAVLHFHKGDRAKAASILEQVVSASRGTAKSDPPAIANTLNALATVYAFLGKTSQAEMLYRRSLMACDQAFLPSLNSATDALASLALLSLDMDRPVQAYSYATNYQARIERNLGAVLAFGSDRQRLAYHGADRPLDLMGTLGRAKDAFTVALRTKGLVLESLISDQRFAQASQDPAMGSQLLELKRAGRRLIQFQTAPNHSLDPRSLQRRQLDEEKLKQQVEAIQKSLLRHSLDEHRIREALAITPEQIQSQIPHTAALLEFVRYRHYLGNAESQDRYAVIVVSPTSEKLQEMKTGELAWVDLGSAEQLDELLMQYSVTMREGGTRSDKVLRDLHTRVFERVRKSLPDSVRTLIVSPDSNLNFLNFGTLLGSDGTFVAEDFTVIYVAASRDLLNTLPVPQSKKRLSVFSNPVYSKLPDNRAEQFSRFQPSLFRGFDLQDYSSLRLDPLPGTAKEAIFLKAQASNWRLDWHEFSGAAATEEQLASLASPHVLHLATHGFFLGGTSPDRRNVKLPWFGVQGSSRKGVENPMLRSGLAFAGAANTLAAWRRGQTPPTDTDGILTAQEVAMLDLRNTWLVFLSACDTGVGLALDGEGVMGLRRGFSRAGAQNVIISLWPVSDRWSVDFMKDFYGIVMTTGDAPQSLADVQARWLKKLRTEKGPLLAARIAGPFILTSRGRPSN